MNIVMTRTSDACAMHTAADGLITFAVAPAGNTGKAGAPLYLQVTLGLLEGSHDAKSAEEVSLGVCGYAWDDGVVGPLPGPQAVGVLGIQEEVVAPVVQREAASLWDDAYDESTTLFDDIAS